MTQQQPPWGNPPPPPQDQWNQQPAPPSPQQWGQQPPPPPPAGWGPPPPSGWGAPPPQAYGYGTNVLVILAGIALLLWGLLWTFLGVVAAGGSQIFEQMMPGFGQMIATLGIVILVIGILHLVAAIFIWAHRSWARYLGIVLAVLGTLLGLASLPAALDPSVSQADSGGGIGGVLLLLIPYGFALIALVVGGNHFTRRYG